MEYKICKKTMRHPLVERMQGRSDDFFAFCRDMSFDLSRIDHEDRCRNFITPSRARY